LRSDGQIVESVLAGDPGAYALLVERYAKPVHGVTLGVLRDFHSAEDAAQDAFVEAYESLGSLRKSERFGSWLLRIARAKAIDRLRRRIPTEPLDPDAPSSVPPPLSDESGEILRSIENLPDREKQVVSLKHFGGLSAREIAETIGESTGTVTKRLSRAYARLRTALKGLEP
jgi:RNA polymerase sigma factor (sigma-70 family)